MIAVHAIAQVDGARRGIHLLFHGPPAWMYAPDGWLVERSLWQRPEGRRLCVNLRDGLLVHLRRERELETPIGIITLRDGSWMHPAGGPARTAEVLIAELTHPTSIASVEMATPNWTAYALRNGKVIAAAPAQTAPGQVVLTAQGIDRVVVHAQHASEFRVCVFLDTTHRTEWTPIARLQLPLREFDPNLGDEDDEWDLARSRLIPGDDLDRATFTELASLLRTLRGDSARPIDRSIRPDAANSETTVGVLDPLRLALLDPVLRRALGLALFDNDLALQLGQTYQYRVSGRFPADANMPRPGVHTVPVGTQLPADFFLGDVRVRLARPSRVEFVPTHTIGGVVVGRPALRVRQLLSTHWHLPDLLDAALVLDFALPRSSIALHFADHVDLRFEAFDSDGAVVGEGDIPDASAAVLTFSSPAARLVLRGEARWGGLSDVINQAGWIQLSESSDPVVLAEPPPPPQPLAIVAKIAGVSAMNPANEPRPRSQLGFDIVWRPALAFDANAWPPDAEAAPPLEATRFELEHEQVGTGFQPIFGKRGVAFGDRANRAREPLTPGADLMLQFPEQPTPPSGALQEFSIRDHFVREPEISLPPPGTLHRYRVRAVDEIGRPGAWRVSDAALLEKRFPPPPPVGAPGAAGETRVTGVRGRVIVRDAPDLTADDHALLEENGSTTAIILTWAWTNEQRELDPWTKEFRVYTSAGGIGPVAGRVIAVTELGGGRFDVDLSLARGVATGAAAGGYLPAGGEYRILAHGSGTTIQATVETLVPAEDGTFQAPRLGATVLPVPFRALQSRPEAWDVRHAVVPLTEADTYQLVLRDLLLPSADAPRVSMWVAVSAADAEPYVEDSRPGGGRPGNESPVVAVNCEARYHGRPTLVAPPPIGDVPAITTARSGTAGVEQDVDLLPFLDGTGLVGGERLIVEYVSDGDLLAALRVAGRDIVGMPPPTAPRESVGVVIPVPNADDHSAIVTALTTKPLDVADRYVVWLGARHPFADWLFVPLESAYSLGQPVHFSFAPGAARYVVRARRVDAAGHRSAGAATCKLVVRVPAVATLAPPAFLGARWTTTPAGPRVEVRTSVSDERSTHLLTWAASTDPRRAELGTVGSRRDLPGFGLRLRLAAGGSLTPVVTTVPADAVLDPTTRGRTVTTLVEADGGPYFVWLLAVDRDGVPSQLSGAYRLPSRMS